MRFRRSPHEPAGRTTDRHKGWILFSLCLAALIINIDVTIVNVTLPSLVKELDATTSDLQWVVDAYSLVFASLVLAAGSLSDRVGRKEVLLAGLAVFTAGTLAGSLATSPPQLIAARAVMGVGAAGIFPATLSLIANVFTGRGERARAIGLWGATTGVGIAAGPIIGGWLLEHFWWGSVFLFMAPVAVVIAGFVVATVPTSRDPRATPIDRRGVLLSTAGMGLLVYGIIEAPNRGWDSPATLLVLGAGIVVLATFVVVERGTARPMLDVGLFRDMRFTAASGAIAVGFFTLTGFTFLITQYFQFLKGYSPLGTGVRLLPVAVSVGVAAIVGTRLGVRVGNKAVVAGGLLLFGATLLWIAGVASASTPYGVIALQMVLGGSGLGLITAPATEAIMGAVPPEKAGVGSAVNDATRLFGATLGVAVIGSIAASLYADRLGPSIPPEVPAGTASAAEGSVGGALIAARELVTAGLTGPGQRLAEAAVDAFLHSLTGALSVAGGISIAGAVVAALFLPSRPAHHEPPLPAAPPDGEEDEAATVPGGAARRAGATAG
jgi:EmrB/QacA subfamily drug resistance transporter